MRTFSEYISESRQKYIFGGTDNRNTQDIKQGIPFMDLKKGDKFYWYVYDDQGDNTYDQIDTFDVQTKPYIKNNKFFFESNHGTFEVPLEYAKEPAFKFSEMNFTYYGSTTCSGIIDVLSYDNIIPRNFAEIEKASLKESKQNYIFGGTDNRNANADSKTIGELEDGDAFYWFSKYAHRAWKLTLSEITKNDNETQVFFHYYYYDDKNKKKIDYCMIPVDEDIYNLTSYLDKNEYFAVAVDETEFLKIVRKYNICKEDIIDETVK